MNRCVRDRVAHNEKRTNQMFAMPHTPSTPQPAISKGSTPSQPLTPASSARLLAEHGLLREIIQGSRWSRNATAFAHCDEAFDSLTYDTRQAGAHSLLFIKGRFRPEFLSQLENGVPACYVAETDYSQHTDAPGIIVDDVQQAMSLLSAQFYGNPQQYMTLIGITGTKGKTTTAYFTHAILAAASHGKAALSSSIAHCLDGEHFKPSHLTTPESLDVFRMMREAADNGMRYFVMEVSSQAYKRERVFGLTFNVGAFLNISPDHISPIEHPTFEDYFYCKRQIIANSKILVLGADCAHAGLLREDAAASGIPVTAFAQQLPVRVPASPASMPGESGEPQEANNTRANVGTAAGADISTVIAITHDPRRFSITADGETLGEFNLAMPGAFNQANAAAAIDIALQAGVPAGDPALHALENLRVPGRMEEYRSRDGIVAYVDFAHNGASVHALLDAVELMYAGQHPYITLVTGSAGNKALDRRQEIVQAALGRVQSFIFTTDDPNGEDPGQIAQQMADCMTDATARAQIVLPREEAIAKAIDEARQHTDRLNVILVIGKGDDPWMLEGSGHVPYEGDSNIVVRQLG
jgi:UDP-N-acetylmuramoyl-L-alanyl-D-glutamate--2,6-diaminopimelate ligase